jgi:histidine kinase/DNA gyrase B/HSP90-like ATPase
VDDKLVDEAVENLVSQFSSSTDFLRELVQNSIDAGSSTVDVWLEWIPGKGEHDDVIAVHVDDSGEGMTSAIIDDQLTQVYSSQKEGDLTKIGKFGIGFVSVFAPKPKAVIVHTGRDGEYWEVWFHEDRSFTKTKLDEPVEGTRITLVIPGDRAAYDDFLARAQAALVRWCAHSEVEITFHDRSPIDGVDRGAQSIRKPFAVDGDCPVVVEGAETTIALAYTTTPEYAFYNRGLALYVSRAATDVLEQRAPRYARIGVKVKSRWLEHTLSRETVIHDENLERALVLLDAAADGALRSALLARLGELAASATWGLREQDEYERLLAHLAGEPTAALFDSAHAKVLRTVDGRAVSLSEVDSCCEEWVYLAERPSRLTVALAAERVPVLLGARGTETTAIATLLVAYLAGREDAGLVQMVRGLFNMASTAVARARARLCHPDDVFVGIRVTDAPDPEFAAIAAGANRLLDRIGSAYREIRLGAIEGQDGAHHFCAIGRKLAPLMPVPGGSYRRGRLEQPAAVIDHEHPHLLALRRLWAKHPRHAAYAFAKSLLLAEDRMLDHDTRLIELAERLPIGADV